MQDLLGGPWFRAEIIILSSPDPPIAFSCQVISDPPVKTCLKATRLKEKRKVQKNLLKLVTPTPEDTQSGLMEDYLITILCQKWKW